MTIEQYRKSWVTFFVLFLVPPSTSFEDVTTKEEIDTTAVRWLLDAYKLGINEEVNYVRMLGTSCLENGRP